MKAQKNDSKCCHPVKILYWPNQLSHVHVFCKGREFHSTSKYHNKFVRNILDSIQQLGLRYQFDIELALIAPLALITLCIVVTGPEICMHSLGSFQQFVNVRY